jgi:hypothetical protein
MMGLPRGVPHQDNTSFILPVLINRLRFKLCSMLYCYVWLKEDHVERGYLQGIRCAGDLSI